MVEELPFCKCGCGQRVKLKNSQFISGHWSRLNSTDKIQRIIVKCGECGKDTVRKITDKPKGYGLFFCSRTCANRYKAKLPEFITNLTAGVRQAQTSELKKKKSDIRKKLLEEKGIVGACGLKGDLNYAKKPEVKAKISLANKGNIFIGHPGEANPSKRLDVREKLQAIAFERWHNLDDKRKFLKDGHHTDEEKRKISESVNVAMENPEYWNNWKKGRDARPNGLEQKIINILEILGVFTHEDRIRDKWRYVGDGTIYIGGKVPDFIHLDAKKIIEGFGDYYHEEVDEKIRIEHFARYGYTTLIIWESDLQNDFNNTILKITEFSRKEYPIMLVK